MFSFRRHLLRWTVFNVARICRIVVTKWSFSFWRRPSYQMKDSTLIHWAQLHAFCTVIASPEVDLKASTCFRYVILLTTSWKLHYIWDLRIQISTSSRTINLIHIPTVDSIDNAYRDNSETCLKRNLDITENCLKRQTFTVPRIWSPKIQTSSTCL